MLTVAVLLAVGVELHVVHLQPSEGHLAVREIFLLQKDGGSGELRFFVPEAAEGNLRVTVQKSQGSPEERTPRRTRQKGVYALDVSVPPGETRIDLTYVVPLAGSRTFSGKVLFQGGPTRLVVPTGFALEGEGLESLGEDPSERTSIYGVQGAEYQVRIREADAAESSEPQIQQILPRVYDHLLWILAPTLLALLLLFILYWLKGKAADESR